MSLLETYGWSPFFASSFEAQAAPGRVPARVVATFKHLYRVVTSEGEGAAEIAGRLRHEAKGPEDFPAVGDWVVLAPRPGEERAHRNDQEVRGAIDEQTQGADLLAGHAQ